MPLPSSDQLDLLTGVQPFMGSVSCTKIYPSFNLALWSYLHEIVNVNVIFRFINCNKFISSTETLLE